MNHVNGKWRLTLNFEYWTLWQTKLLYVNRLVHGLATTSVDFIQIQTRTAWIRPAEQRPRNIPRIMLIDYPK